MSLSKPSVLVTGGAGYIGSHACRQLLDRGYSVVVVDNLSTGWAWAVPEEAVFLRGDIADSHFLSTVFREHPIDAVMHFAGSTRVDESVRDPLKYYRNNAWASQQIIESCVAFGVKKFVFSSSAAVYGNSNRLPVTEDCATSPLSPYGNSKLQTELVLRDLALSNPSASAKDGFRYVSLRYFNVAGARLDASLGQATPHATHLIKVACEAASGHREYVEIFGTDYATEDGTGVRDYIHVEDLADAHLHALAYLEQGGASQTFNCGYGHGFSVREVLATVRSISGVDFQIRESGRRPGDVPVLYADSSRLREVLGWKPRLDDLKVICESALRWEQRLRQRMGGESLGSAIDHPNRGEPKRPALPFQERRP